MVSVAEWVLSREHENACHAAHIQYRKQQAAKHTTNTGAMMTATTLRPDDGNNDER
jgi:hypothetical protein